uniref:Disease resistance protein winged helix domain-containing protein n=1 Tax=Quercus lobata TaxID=97700 RepID=A0A7N2MG15_QUELO
MAEGFVELIEGCTLEEVADSYLVELNFCNMLLVIKRNEYGRPRRCKMHDLLRELALSLSNKEKFAAVHGGGGEMKECKARRISIHKTHGELEPFTSNVKEADEMDLCVSIQNMPHLRLMSIELCFITSFPKLTELRIRNFPQLNEIIIEKGVMPSVQFLWIDSCMELKTVPKSIEYLNLQKLFWTYASTGLKSSIEGEGSMDFPKVQNIPKIYIRDSSSSGYSYMKTNRSTEKKKKQKKKKRRRTPAPDCVQSKLQRSCSVLRLFVHPVAEDQIIHQHQIALFFFLLQPDRLLWRCVLQIIPNLLKIDIRLNQLGQLSSVVIPSK